jgi:hypothetical protein
MLSADDLIILPYTPDLTQAGIAYVCRTLPDVSERSSTDIFPHTRRIVTEQAAELAFRRHLSEQNVPHNLAASSFFAGSARACAVIGGRYCDVYSGEIFRKGKIHRLHQNSASLLSASAMVPSNVLSSEQRAETDLLIFSFVTALVTPNFTEVKRAASAGQPLYLVYPLPAIWSRRSSWSDLGHLVFKSESNQPLTVTMLGQAEDRSFQTEEMNLPPLCRVKAHSIFYSLAYLNLTDIPSARLGVHSPKLGKTILIRPYEWGNIWVYGMRVYLAGWITRGDFQRLAGPYQPNRTGWQSDTPGNKYLAMPVSELRSLKELFSKAIDWVDR